METGTILGIAGVVMASAIGTWVRIVISKINGAPTHEDFKELKKLVNEAIREGGAGRKELWEELNRHRENFARFQGKMEGKMNGGSR